ncbi:MAG: hypothetical protein AVDCRST_MAG24-1553 [uncultured Nocardioidaceae bacterium]|uniref:Uncharacterized protein n=1 Tax=uncultured Nocardioidaceae bacterium TaxID=253824 RepID=A0A6J4M0L4_9ACTN|nr:MAG: hypothetical protein AVDCRST_MAG24-1553 [uncultured Nocardioidaceae bacterium]
MSLPGDEPGADDGDHRVDGQQAQQPLDVGTVLDRHDQQRTHEPEDGPRCTDRRLVDRRQPVDREAPGQPREQVQREEPHPSEKPLELRSEDVEREHVEPDVPELHMGEERGHELPERPVGDAGEQRTTAADPVGLAQPRRGQPELAQQVAAPTPGEEQEDEDHDVDPDEDLRHQCVTDRAPAVRRAGLAHRLGALPDALRTLEPDGRLPHAVGADRPLAPLAADVGLAVGVAVAPRRGQPLRADRGRLVGHPGWLSAPRR